MARIMLATLVAVACLTTSFVHIDAAEPDVPNQDIALSPEVSDLLRAEMRELSAGMQGIPVSLANADWASIQATSSKMHASYIMAQKLTAAQAQELEQVLPDGFKQLDADFHRRAEKLGRAAAAHDAEGVAFQYARLMESCARCHSTYAKSRFPGFAPAAPEDHAH
ncbi:cytochrome c [Elongatibacter sediminis]|uniref:Cytochrome c n=1 Tax=Elongatibacter sediminis TaxID=3119006 RepID=A0AAW9RKG4_9GAMM